MTQEKLKRYTQVKETILKERILTFFKKWEGGIEKVSIEERKIVILEIDDER